jgi:hypothetical protein
MEDILEVLFNELTASENVLSNELCTMNDYKEIKKEALILEEKLLNVIENKELARSYDTKKNELSHLREYAIFKVAFKMGSKFIMELVHVVHDKEEVIIQR